MESKRLLSLDVFRGLAMAAMVLVENPGSEHIYPPLLHAQWHNEPITFKDCVLPLFLFAMGVSITLSLTRRLRAGVPRGKIFRKIVFRSLIILALGLLLHFIYFGVARVLIALGRVWGLIFPISRDLWAGSYVLYTAGLAMLVWSFCYWLIEVRGYKKWTPPFAAYGTSCIFIFVASHVFAFLLYIIRIPTGPQKSIYLKV